MLSSTLLCAYVITTIHATTREEEYAKLGPHDKVSFDLTHFKSDNQLEFDFLGEHYKVQLRRNDNHLPTLIKTSGDIDPFSSLSDDNCHYHGHVLEPHQPDGSYLSLSLCANRGIRGTITLPSRNEQLLILPSTFITDPQYDREVGIYQLTEPHMIYKEHSESVASRPHDDVLGSIAKGGSRGLLSRNWRNKVELYVLVDAAWTYLFKRKYSTRWLSELKSYTTELINAASSEYEWWDWGNLGTISIHMVELEIMGDYTGRYSVLKPSFAAPRKSTHADCRNRDWKWNNYACFNSFASLKQWKPVLGFGKYHEGKKGDVHLMLTGFKLDRCAGVARKSSMCTRDSTAVVDCDKCYEIDFYKKHTYRVRAVAHEIGHTFGADHTSLVGVMGKGKGSSGKEWLHSGWSNPTVRDISAYFDKSGGLSCLRNGVRSFKVTNKVNTGSSSGNTGSTSGNYNGNTGSSSGGSGCIEIKYVSSSYNGEYKKGSNGIYSSGKYQFLFKRNGKWTLNYRDSAINSNYVCYKSNILDCDRNWYVYGERVSNGRSKKCGSFTADDDAMDCVSNNEYDDAMCVYDLQLNDTNELTFVMRRDECYTDHVVYESEDGEYVLFYHEDYEFNDDEEMRGQWMISQYEIRIIDAVATCDEEDLLQCVDGKWNVIVANNDTVDKITHATMSVSNGYCESYEGARVVGEEEEEEKKDATVYIVCVGLLSVVILIAVGCFVYRSRRTKQLQFALDRIEDESEGEDIDEHEELEVDAEVEETNLTQTAQ